MGNHSINSLFETQQLETIPCTHIIRVAFESAADTGFDYLVPDELWPIQPGQRVKVPLGKNNRPEVAFCIVSDVPPDQSFAARKTKRSLKIVSKIIDAEPLLNSQLMELAKWISSYYVCPLGQVLAAMVPAGVKRGAGARKQKYVYLVFDSEASNEDAEKLRGKKQKQIVQYLQKNKAFNAKSALPIQSLLQLVGCTNEPVKRLVRKQIVTMVGKTTLRSLPVMPGGMELKTEKVILNEDQQKALAHLNARINAPEFGVTLLHGVTDSGKTELYIRAIEAVIRKGKTAIALLPEIALTTQTVQRFSTRFENIAVMHSGLTAWQRNAQWQKIKTGDADVVIGARSAVFAPLGRLGLVIVDEEHEPSYKQDTAPRYNGRDVAIKRAQLAGAHCILGSATPSLETMHNCKTKSYFHLVRLPRRVMNLPMPEMKLIDMRQTFSAQKGINLISGPLERRLKEILARKEQAILLLNRRGYSNFVFCPSCKHTLHCRNCDVTLTFHKSTRNSAHRIRTVTGKHINYGYAVCHYCLAQTLVPEKCPICGKGLAMIGTGSQRLEEELAAKFPHVRLARVDSDSMSGKDYYRVLKDFTDGRIDVLAGTQMLAKGLHFPNVTLVGVISADTSLYLPDFRANERTFQLISQVAGRAGRSPKKGTVFVQTFLPDQPAIQFALKNDYVGFTNEELKHRKACSLPPYRRLAVMTIRGLNFEKLEVACRIIRQRIDDIVEKQRLEVLVRGPLPAVITRIQRFHRMQIIIQADRPETIRKLFTAFRAQGPVRPTVKLAIDVDPVNLL